jgi:hypothetical protein
MGDRKNDLTLAEVSQPLPTIHRTLGPGMEGHDVARLQAGLRRLGYVVGPIDGIFGDRTGSAIAEYCIKRKWPGPAVADPALWSEVARDSALAQVDTIEAYAGSLEASTTGPRDAAAALQKTATDLRAQALPAGEDEEKAAGELLRAAQRWRAAADAWALAAQQISPYWDPEGRGFKAFARQLRALDQARSHGARVVNSLALANKDFEALGGTEHRERIAAAIVVGRGLAAG